jgi:hypothetical protein
MFILFIVTPLWPFWGPQGPLYLLIDIYGIILVTHRRGTLSVRKYLVGLLYDQNYTPSLGRHLAVASFALLATTVGTCLILLSYIVMTGQMEQAAPLATAVATPLASLLGSSAISGLGSYVAQRIWPQGGVPDLPVEPPPSGGLN